MARGEWGQAGVFAERARTALRRAGIEESYATPLVCAAQARAALHRADMPAVRRELVPAQRLRHEVAYLAVQPRIELTRVHIALAGLAGARTLMRELDELLRRRPGLGTPGRRGRSAPGRAVEGARTARSARAPPPVARLLSAANRRQLSLIITPRTLLRWHAELVRRWLCDGVGCAGLSEPGPSSATSSTNTSGPHESPGQDA